MKYKIGLATIVSALVAVWFEKSRGPRTSLPLEPTLTEVTLSNGSKLEILKVGIGNLTLVNNNAPQPIVATKSSQKTGFTGSYYTIDQTATNGEISKVEFSRNGSSDLLIALKLQDSQGLPSHAKTLGGWGEVFGYDVEGTSLVDVFPHQNISLVSDIIAGSAEYAPEMLFQLQNPSGQWVNGFGPLTIANTKLDSEYHSFAIFSGWQPQTGDLNFRVITPGNEPISFKVAAPSPPQVAPPINPAPLP